MTDESVPEGCPDDFDVESLEQSNSSETPSETLVYNPRCADCCDYCGRNFSPIMFYSFLIASFLAIFIGFIVVFFNMRVGFGITLGGGVFGCMLLCAINGQQHQIEFR